MQSNVESLIMDEIFSVQKKKVQKYGDELLTSSVTGLSGSAISSCGAGMAKANEHKAIAIIAKHFHDNPSIFVFQSKKENKKFQ